VKTTVLVSRSRRTPAEPPAYRVKSSFGVALLPPIGWNSSGTASTSPETSPRFRAR